MDQGRSAAARDRRAPDRLRSGSERRLAVGVARHADARDVRRPDGSQRPAGDAAGVVQRREPRPLLAVAVSGRGLVDPGEPVLAADDEGSRAGARRSRRCGSTAAGRSGSRSTWRGSPRSASASASSRPTRRDRAARGARARARGAPDAVLRLYWTPGPPGGSTARSRSSARSRPGSRRLARAASGSSRCCTSAARRRGCSRHEVDELRGQHRRGGRGEGARRRRRVFVDADGIVLEGPVTNIWWREGDVLADAVARGRHPRRRDARRAARARRAQRPGRRGGRLPARAAARRRRGVHVVLGARGDPGRRGRRASVRARPGRGGAAGGASARGAA